MRRYKVICFLESDADGGELFDQIEKALEPFCQLKELDLYEVTR